MSVSSDNSNQASALAGALLGTAVGDALGLPMEGLSRSRQQRLFAGPLRQQLIANRGMVSDDTEHTVMVARALAAHPRDMDRFARSLAWQFRWWLCGLPAGVGFATLRGILKLWLGFPPTRSGIFSAGNGPAMRSAILGVYFASDENRRQSFVRVCTRITHTDPRAEIAAQAVAETAAWMCSENTDESVLLRQLRSLSDQTEWTRILQRFEESLAAQLTTGQFAECLQLSIGVTGYAFHTAPVAIYSALRHRNNFQSALEEIIRCGGDTDTTAAITGALVGAHVGIDGIPIQWRSAFLEWPALPSILTRLAKQIAANRSNDSVARNRGEDLVSFAFRPLRNIVFLAVVLCHGLRRLFPPY